MVRFAGEELCRFCGGDHTAAVLCGPKGPRQSAQIAIEELESLLKEDLFFSIGDRRWLANRFKQLRKLVDIPDAPIYTSEEYDLAPNCKGYALVLWQEIRSLVEKNGVMAEAAEAELDEKMTAAERALKL